jgi:hypothetical protein
MTTWVGGFHDASAQLNSDPLRNPAHINGLPADVRIAVRAMCRQAPSAGHYFATYNHDQVNLHSEHFHCNGQSFCSASKCLHQTYRLNTATID